MREVLSFKRWEVGRGWNAKGFTISNRQSISGGGLALENVWAVVNWFKEALSRKMEPENLLPYMEMARFHSSKGDLRARGTKHPHPNLIFKTAWHRHFLLSCGIKPLPPPPPPTYGDVARRGLGIKALSIFSFTCCLPLDIKSFVNKIPFLGEYSCCERAC